MGRSAGVVLGEGADGTVDVWVLDVSDAQAPRVLGELSTSVVKANLNGVALDASGELALLSLGTEGLWALDVSLPSSPRVVSKYATPGIAEGVVLKSGLAYVAVGTGGLEIVDVSVPSSPRRIGGRSLVGYAIDVVLWGSSKAVVLDRQGTVQLLDLSSVSSPALLDQEPLSAFGTSLAISGSRVAVLTAGSSDNAVEMYTLSSSSLRSAGRVVVGPPGTTSGVAMSGSGVYVGAHDEGLLALSDTGSTVVESGVLADTLESQKADGAQGLAVVAGMNLATGRVGVKTLDVSGAVPRVVGELSTSVVIANLHEVVVDPSGTLAVLALGSEGLWTLELSDTSAPRVLSVHDTPGLAWGVALDPSGRTAYVADGLSGLQVVDLSNPRAPRTLGTLSEFGLMRDVAVSGDTVYLADQQGKLHSVDVSVPSQPQLRSSRDLVGFGLGVAVDGDLGVVLTTDPSARVGSDSAMEIFDLSTPTSPVSQGFVWLGSPGTGQEVVLQDGVAYVAASGDGLQVWDLSRPTAPQLEDSGWIVGEGRGISVRGALLYVADDPATISVIAPAAAF